MRRLLLIFIFVMLLHLELIVAYDTEQNTYIVHVHEDGKAIWTIEHRFQVGVVRGWGISPKLYSGILNS